MAAQPVIASGRDVRLDLFRGLALWFIYIDHVPTNIVSWLTVRNYGFSDATEIFVFISGYTAVIAYARMMERDGWIRAAKENGLMHVCTKPWDDAELKQLIRDGLDLPADA